jgi:xylulose-5-phosphate/fructose-6-phosphate phosphoketolase
MADIAEVDLKAGRGPLGREELDRIDAWWRAANYLSVGQIYLLDNPLLREPLRLEHIKPRLLGHWGTTPGLNFVYAHLNRVIVRDDLDAIYVTGPGHGGPGLVANVYLEGTYSEVYPPIGQDTEGLRRLFRQFSFPGGIPSHVAPETPGSINEGGELGYSLVHAYGAAFDNPDLLVCCVVGDGEAETGPLATSWHANKFLNPASDGAVLPVLHLNGYKIANPTILARIPEAELRALLEGYGYAPRFVSGSEPEAMHQAMAATLDEVVAEIAGIQQRARAEGDTSRPRWPMIVLRTPKGWTGPAEVDGVPVEGTWRSHQVPLAGLAQRPDHLAALEAWLRSYRPEELFDDTGALRADVAELVPKGERRMGANPAANGGRTQRPLELPDFRDYAVEVPEPGAATGEATRVLGGFLRDVITANPTSFRLMGPDETNSNRLNAVFETTHRAWTAEREPGDDHLAPAGRVMEVLSEHLCQGWLEGYTLTGRHGLFNCYEAFIHIVDSMFNQHAKWLESTNRIDWRRPIPSLNYLLSSHVWRQDHNGFSHQDPGFIDLVVNKQAGVIRVYLPAQPPVRQRDRGRQAARPAVPVHGRGGPALRPRHRDLGVGQQRRRRPRCGAGLRRRHPHPGNPGRHRPVAGASARAAGAGDQRGRPDAPPARLRASPRAPRPRVRRPVHHRPAGHLRLPRLPVTHPPAHLPPPQPRRPARARVQGGGHHDHALRHGHAQRP